MAAAAEAEANLWEILLKTLLRSHSFHLSMEFQFRGEGGIEPVELQLLGSFQYETTNF